jgi:hypothetical protein
MLTSLGDTEREQLWDLLRRMADTLELCPTNEEEACLEAVTDQDPED